MQTTSAITAGVIYKRGEEWDVNRMEEFLKEDVNKPKFGWRRTLHLPSLERGFNISVYQRKSETAGMVESVRYDATFTNCPNPSFIIDFFTKSMLNFTVRRLNTVNMTTHI